MEEEEYDELEDVTDDGTLGGVMFGPSEDKTDSVATEIPFGTVHDPALPFRDRRRKVFIPNTSISVRISKYERSVTKHLLNPYLYTINIEHGGFSWTIHKRYKHFLNLHNHLKLFRSSLSIPFPSETHKFNRQSLKELKESGDGSEGQRKGSLPRFPKRPEVMIGYDQIDDRAIELEDYLNKLLTIKLYRDHPETVQFLLASHVSFVTGLGVKGMEDLVKKQTGSTRKGCDCFGLSENVVCVRCSHVCSDAFGGWRERWLFVKDTFLAYMRPKDGMIKGVMLFDHSFEVSTGLYSAGMRNRLQIINLQRRIVFKCHGKRKRLEWSNYLKEISNKQGYGFTVKNKNSSFAPQRSDTSACWFADGSSYMEAVADAISNAKEEIFIADWWLSPEIYLKRPALQGHQWRLDSLLEKKACEGVKIFVLLYKEVELALGINSYYSKSRLAKCNPQNVKVLRHPDHANSGVFLWAHHEKIVCVDQSFAFLGGIDLCYGRWDDHKHKLSDFGALPTCENPHKKKITSSRPLGSKPRPLVALVQASNNIGVGTMTSFQSNTSEGSVEIEPELEQGKAIADLEVVNPSNLAEGLELIAEEPNGDVPLTLEEEEVACQPSQENIKQNTPEMERKPLLRRFQESFRESSKQILNKLTGEGDEKEGDLTQEVINEEVEEKKEVPFVENVPLTPDDEITDPLSISKDIPLAVKYWIGKDYTNFIVKDFCDLDSPYQDLVDRTTTPRMPWHDIGVMVHGAAARDVARHFIQRWNAVKDEKAKKINTYPYLIPKSYEYFDDSSKILPDSQYKVRCQVLRSLSAWSGGFLDPDIWEESIHEAYITSIAKSQHYIYIENQFFISLARPNPYVKNQIGEAICKRIMKAHKDGKKFRVFVIIPLLPGFEGEVGGASGTALRAITHWNYASICRGNDSIMSRLQELGVENPSEYITFHGLRTNSEFHGDHVTELIYVHSKLMIVDDKIVICGSANINDRSMIGKRDSEIAVITEDEDFVEGLMNGETVEIGKYASSLRKYLFSEHLGILSYNNSPCDSGDWVTTPDFDINDPISDEFYNNVWVSTSKNNTQIYEEVFRCLPSDKVTSFTELQEYQEGIPLLTSDPTAAKAKISEIKGHLVDLPLNFLMNEILTPNPKSVEGMMPTSLWT